MKAELQKEWFSIEQCNQNPYKLYVFGDNTLRKESFFTDSIECLEVMEDDIRKLILESENYDIVVFPSDGLGTGLSDMPNKCPLLFKRMNKILNKHFKVNLSI